MANNRNRSGIYMKSGLLATIGIIFVLIAHYFVSTVEAALHEVGFALLVSVAVWLLFEHQLSLEAEDAWDARIERVAKNVFQAVLRKDLPKGLLDEANNLVLNSSVIRRGFTTTYTLTDSTFADADGRHADCVLVEAVMEFTMDNVSSDVFCYNVVLGLPNPVHAGLKEHVGVRRLEVFKGGEPVGFDLEVARRNFQEELATVTATTINFRAGTVELQPGESCNFSATYVMAKEPEDSELLQTLYPADGIRVTVFDQAGDGRRVTFARSVHRKSLEHLTNGEQHPRAKIFKIPGYLLPHQGVLIWWKKRPGDHIGT